MPLWSALRICCLLALFGPPADEPALPNAAAAQQAFDRFRALEGTWRGQSTRGWNEDVSFKTIAAGSAVIETSFDAHPNETMVSLYRLDGDALDLTHYCVAKNQPHLRATAFEEDGRRIIFTFVDGGNLPSRNKGHMDKLVVRFEDSGHVTKRWTWYQDGRESWMEEIRLVRKK